MITDNGKIHIKRYLAQYVPSIGQMISFGIGSTPAAGTDSTLAFEVANAPVNLVSYDFIANKLVFKATVPPEFAGKIHEIGLHSGAQMPFNSKIITTFDSLSEEWTLGNGSWNANARIGSDAIRHTPAASGSTTSILSNFVIDLSENSGSDTFKFALNIGNANTSAVRFRIMTTPANYFEYNDNTANATTAGYKIIEVPKGSLGVTGSPDWANITRMEVTTVSKSSGASQVDFDSIRIDDKLSVNDNLLVARKVLDTPSTSISGQAQDIEFALDISL